MMEFLPVQVIEERPISIRVWFERHGCSDCIGKSQLRPGSVRRVGDRGKLVVEDWLGRRLMAKLGVEASKYDDGYTDGVEAGYHNGYRAGRDKGAAEARESIHSNVHNVYRRVMFKWHPDRGGDSRAATALNELWQAISAGLK